MAAGFDVAEGGTDVDGLELMSPAGAGGGFEFLHSAHDAASIVLGPLVGGRLVPFQGCVAEGA